MFSVTFVRIPFINLLILNIMERKKSKKADLEWRKSSFFQVGVIVSLSLVLMAFEFIGTNEKTSTINFSRMEIDEDIIVIPTKIDPELPKPKPAPSTILDIVKTNDIIEYLPIDVTVNPGDEMDEYFDIDEPEDKNNVNSADIVYDMAGVSPSFVGGDNALLKFLSDNIVYPKVARDAGIYGKVIVSFVVSLDGSINDIKIVRGAAPSLNEEAMRVVNLMPKWIPGRQGNKVVKVRYMLPIEFSLY